MSEGHELFGTVHAAGDVVFREGDPGDAMYVVQSGRVEIRRQVAGADVLIAELAEGDFFGEMALLDDAQRTATATVAAEARLLPLTASSLVERVRRDPDVALRLLRGIAERLAAAPPPETPEAARSEAGGEPAPAASVDETHVAESISGHVDDSCLADLESLEFDTGAVIVREGDADATMFVIAEGVVEVTRESGVLARLGPNDVFGEMALLGVGARTATVTAATPVRVLTVDRAGLEERLRATPELGLYLFQTLIAKAHSSGEAAPAPRSLPARLARKDRVSVAFVSLASCAGCIVELLDDAAVLGRIAERADVVYCPLLVDADVLPEADVVIVDGAVRTAEEAETLREARAKAGLLVAWGTCATHGGIPSMANDHEVEELIAEAYGEVDDAFGYYLAEPGGGSPRAYQGEGLALLRRARAVTEHARVDLLVPGCPPPVALLLALLDELAGIESAPESEGMVCRDCPRKPRTDPVDTFSMALPPGTDPALCMTSAGTPCMGFLTRGGCEAVCTSGGLPCWGCRGVSKGAAGKMDAGRTLEQVMTEGFAKRCRAEEADVSPMLRAMRSRGPSTLGFEQPTANERPRMR